MRPLRLTMRLNALTCAGFGTTFVLFGPSVSAFLGGPPALLAQVAGGLLILNALHLIVASGRERLSRAELSYFVAGDTAWVLATLALLGLGVIDTAGGIVAALLTGSMVGGFAVIQAWKLRALDGKSAPLVSQRS